MANEDKHRYRRDNRSIAMLFLLLLVIILVIAFFIMLILFLMYRTEDRAVGNIFVYDLDGANWADDEELQIFYNDEFGSNTVAPYSAGTYTFMFQNLSEYTLEYTVTLEEANEYDIAMCYKIKRDGAYLEDEYTRVADLTSETITIEGNSTQYFQLEWYWDGDVSDANDTLAGINASIYTLTITLTATVA